MIALAASGAEEALWLRAERQTSGRGRQGREWMSPAGNMYASTLVRLRATDPAAATLALVAAVALAEVVAVYLDLFPGEGRDTASGGARPGAGPRREKAMEGVQLKWPNDLMLDGAKLSGILLERAQDAIVIGFGVNLAHHPDLPERPTTSLAAHGAAIEPGLFLETLGEAFARWLAVWRSEGLAPIRARWLERAHPIGAALTARLPDSTAIDGLFDGLDRDGALILRLADGNTRVIHAADVFLL